MESDSEDSDVRINYRIKDPELKHRLKLTAISRGQSLNDLLNDIVTESLPSDSPEENAELERKRLEARLDDVDRQISRLQSGKRFQHLKGLCESLAQAYPQFAGDFRQIRIRAVSDYTSRRLPVSGIEREHVIAEACLQGAKLTELNDRKQQLEKQLVEVYGLKLEKPTRKEQPPKEEEIDWPIYAVHFTEANGGVQWLWRGQVAEAKPGSIPLTFPDGKRGLAWEVKGRPELELATTEILSVPRMMQVSASVAQALKRQLREAAAALRLDQEPS
jgi:hypothetical protein